MKHTLHSNHILLIPDLLSPSFSELKPWITYYLLAQFWRNYPLKNRINSLFPCTILEELSPKK